MEARPVTPASGSPPAIPFAVVTRSGSTSSSSHANQVPVRQNPVWISSATKTAPADRDHSASVGRKPFAGTTNPPSPWIGSTRTAATLSAPTCLSIMPIASAAAASPDRPPSRSGYDIGIRYTSPANGPKRCLYGIDFAVNAIVRLVRPWYAWSNAMTAGRPVACRAILTAFSTASAPELNSAERFSQLPGVSALSCSLTAT
jgi:hypothetical protein